jgi:hypothetical protein
MAQRIGFIPSEGVLKAESKSRKPMQGKNLSSIFHPCRADLSGEALTEMEALAKAGRRPVFASLRQPMPAYASLCQLMPATPPGSMSAKPSSIANHLACHSPSPGGEGWGLSRRSTAKADEGELNLRGLTSALASLLSANANPCQLSPPPHFICPPLIPIYIFCPNDKG